MRRQPFGVNGEGLFDDDVRAGAERLHDVVGVGVVRRGDDDAVDVVGLDEGGEVCRVEGGDGSRCAQFLDELLVELHAAGVHVREGDEFGGIGVLAEDGADVHFRAAAGAD
jgi:hypothetical protein